MLNCSARLAMSTGVLKAMPGKLDIKSQSPSMLFIKNSFEARRIIYEGHPIKNETFFIV